jgi:hypothetical protein
MFAFRFETYQNSVVKHHMRKAYEPAQPAMWAFNHDLHKTTVSSVRQIDADTIEITKRYNMKPSMAFRYFGAD